jgi:hypothetical protein
VAVLLVRSEPAPPGTAVSPGAGATTTTTPASTVAGGRIPTPTAPGYPSPPPGAVVLAREAGTRALGLAIVPGSPTSLVRVSVLAPSGAGEKGLAVTLHAGGTALALPPCGAGCYQAEAETSRLTGTVQVALGTARYGFHLPPTLELPDAGGIVARAGRVWRALKTLVWHERLAASPTDALHTVYRAVAPNELAYTIEHRSSSIIIGTTRWDQATRRSPWVASAQLPPIRQPLPFWAGVSNARVLGSSSLAGKPVWIVSFFDPLTPAWFEAKIEKSTGRTLILDMTAVAHFMHHVYGPFNAPFQLHPPPA